MSALKPPMKQPRTLNQSQVTRTESVDLQTSLGTSSAAEEERNPHTSSQPSKTNLPSHPKGHKVKLLSEVWKTMDSQSFLHLTDSQTLGDVWVQPVGVEPSTGAYVTVHFKQIVFGYHIKSRIASSKMSSDDLLKMLYLNDCLQWDMQGLIRLGFDDWLNEKSAACVKVKGLDEGSNRAKLCNFIITEDRDFTFYPQFLKNCCGLFFRKICCHSYKTPVGEHDDKLDNPSMIKCCATRGKFEYVLEARVFPLPDKWFSTKPEEQATLEVPATQPMN